MCRRPLPLPGGPPGLLRSSRSRIGTKVPQPCLPTSERGNSITEACLSLTPCRTGHFWFLGHLRRGQGRARHVESLERSRTFERGDRGQCSSRLSLSRINLPGTCVVAGSLSASLLGGSFQYDSVSLGHRPLQTDSRVFSSLTTPSKGPSLSLSMSKVGGRFDLPYVVPECGQHQMALLFVLRTPCHVHLVI